MHGVVLDEFACGKAIAAAHHEDVFSLAGIAHGGVDEGFVIAVLVVLGELDMAVNEQA